MNKFCLVFGAMVAFSPLALAQTSCAAPDGGVAPTVVSPAAIWHNGTASRVQRSRNRRNFRQPIKQACLSHGRLAAASPA